MAKGGKNGVMEALTRAISSTTPWMDKASTHGPIKQYIKASGLRGPCTVKAVLIKQMVSIIREASSETKKRAMEATIGAMEEHIMATGRMVNNTIKESLSKPMDAKGLVYGIMAHEKRGLTEAEIR